DDFTIWNWGLATAADRLIEAANQFCHSKILVKATTNKIRDIDTRIFQVLPRELKRRNKVGKITFVRTSFAPNYRTSSVIHKNRTTRAVDTQLADAFHLC